MRGISRETSVQRENPAGALVSLICLTVFAVVFVIYTTSYLPDTVATHFGRGNQANGWMSREGYLFFILSFMIGISTLVSFVVGSLPRKFPQWTNVPNRDYWLSTERREESLRYLNAHDDARYALHNSDRQSPAPAGVAVIDLYCDLARLLRGADLVDRAAVSKVC